ncbi:MAG: carbon monoxide dehydrogenase [Acidobacteria bacterium]|nr:MAG: carbon monoxide dehydrogenase [Acidobacteriota bacterium]
MKVSGSYLLPGTPEQVWALLNDPERLAKCLPGCERLEPDGPDRYKAVVKFALAAISGQYSGSVELADKKPPHSLRLRLEGKGVPGFVKGDGQLELWEKGGQTEVHYSGEAQIGGMIAAVGQRMLDAAARKIIQQFFENAAAQLQGPPVEGEVKKR